MPASWYRCSKCGYRGPENPEFPATRCPRCHSAELESQDAPNTFDPSDDAPNPYGLK
jgi:hypothetical protein